MIYKLGFFQSKGFSSPDVIKIISSYPWVFKYSLQNQLVPAFDFLETSLQSDAEAIKAIKLFPRLLNVTVETMARVVDVLRDNGVPEEHCSANSFPAFRYGFKSGEFKKAYRGSDSNGIPSFQESVC
ncbi:hypothetical protein DKX38_005357 [Salix brachista]|uniref:Uncharacterized protein n=1 Tax=Salix brachista TaxID=2182728 RepID=A0A5N5MZB8_9ROSI|nr:hypothetical protein DKX38_005357 [Salix brachista]